VLCDPQCSFVATGLLCQFFSPSVEALVQPTTEGEIIIARDLWVRAGGKQLWDLQGVGNEKTQVKHVGVGFDMDTLTPKERDLVKNLQEWWNTRGGAAAARNEVVKRDVRGTVINEPRNAPSSKLQPISNLFANKFYDLIVEVDFPASNFALG
jgi:hypothetical protein